MSSDVRIDVLTDAIKQLPKGEMKDALVDDLKFAQDINGTQDPALKGIKRLVISGVRKELLAHERIKSAINDHIATCRFVPSGQLGEVTHAGLFRWAETLKPYRWPVAVVCFSPFAGDIITKVIAVFK